MANRMTSLFRAMILTIGLASLAGLTACEAPPMRPAYPELTYTHLPQFRLDVARIEIENAYHSPGHRPNVEQEFPVKPAVAAERALRDRLRAVGTGGVARAVIQNASVVEVPLKRTTGLRGALTTDQTERYDGVIEVVITVVGANPGDTARVVSRVERTRSVAEDASINDREKLWFDMTEALVNDLNASLDRQINEYFKNFLR